MVLTTARRPAILVEMGYSTNPEDGRFLTSFASQKAMASALADAVVDYLLEYERKTSPRVGDGWQMKYSDHSGSPRCSAGASTTTGCTTPIDWPALPEKAEREGRTFDATSLWGQVATKAESVIVRHPTSKYAEEASVLRGVALARMGQCDEALGPLSRVGLTGHREDLTEEALLATGRCQLALGNLSAGDASFSQLIQSKDPERRREAHYQHARLLRLQDAMKRP